MTEEQEQEEEAEEQEEEAEEVVVLERQGVLCCCGCCFDCCCCFFLGEQALVEKTCSAHQTIRMILKSLCLMMMTVMKPYLMPSPMNLVLMNSYLTYWMPCWLC